MAKRTLSDELEAAAARFARSALQAQVEEDPPVYLLHASTALELLAKAYLASIHGSLVAAPDFDSLLHACGHPAHARKPRTRMRTITVGEALNRVGQILPSIANLRPALDLLAEVRNGVVHAGLLDTQTDEEVLLPFVRACDVLLGAMGRDDRLEFWGDFLELVDVRLSQSAQAAELRVVDAIAAARVAFDRRFGVMGDLLKEALFSAIQENYEPERYEQDLIECPACGRSALVYGAYDVSWEPDWDYGDGQSYVAGVYPVVTFRPGTLECRFCGLGLDGEDELRAAGVSESWKLEHVDPSDFYEPDDDDWR